MIVVLDACVFYPPSLHDLLLTLAAPDAFDIRWSDEILDELTRNVIDDNPAIDPARFVEHTITRMRAAFPDAMTPPDPGAVEKADHDPKDRHVAAVALIAEADAIVTIHMRDFRGRAARDQGWSWDVIATELGVTKQAVHKKHAGGRRLLKGRSD